LLYSEEVLIEKAYTLSNFDTPTGNLLRWALRDLKQKYNPMNLGCVRRLVTTAEREAATTHG
jgi:hypothetical protein